MSISNKAYVSALDHDLSLFIRSCGAIQSYKTIVEEILLNALDARATKIEVYVDLPNYSIKITDNGVGIGLDDLKKHIGVFSSTSKTLNGSYGCKGEAIAAISKVSNVEVISRQKGSDAASFSKLLYRDEAIKSVRRDTQGTTVIIQDIFHNIPVRRVSLKSQSEIFRIRELINKMAVLHYRVGFILYDYYSKKMLVNVPQDLSLSSRLSRFHPESVARNMEPLSLSYHGYHLFGSMSPPSLECCSCNKDCQYLYINNRWIRSGEKLSTTLNAVYKAILNRRTGGGPRPQHCIVHEALRAIYPNYVLQLVIPEGEYDILIDPDKSKIIFNEEEKVLKCLSVLLNDFLTSQRPDLSMQVADALSCIISVDESTAASVPMKKIQRGSRCYPLTKGINGTSDGTETDLNPTNLADTIPGSEGRRAGVCSASSVSFQEAFGEDSSDSSSDHPHAIRYSSKDIRSADIHESDNELIVEAFQLDRSVEVTRDPDHLTAYYDSLLGRDELWIHGDDIDRVEWSSDQVGDAAQEEHASISDASDSREMDTVSGHYIEKDELVETRLLALDLISPCHIPVQQRSPINLNSNFRARDQGMLGTPTSSFLLAEKIKLTKEHIREMVFISQWDLKFILTSAGGLLLAVDQHAADERVKLESYWNEIESIIEGVSLPSGLEGPVAFQRLVPLSSIDEIVINSKLAAGARNHAAVIEAWGFGYSIRPNSSNKFALDVDRTVGCRKRRHGEQDDLTSTYSASSDVSFGHLDVCESFMLRVEKTPVVLQEQLLSGDFVEYLEYLSDLDIQPTEHHFTGSDNFMTSGSNHYIAMQKPPSVFRIIASKACRNAIKFGTLLDKDQCNKLIYGLSFTSMPFQCAHGRPTVYPILDISSLGGGGDILASGKNCQKISLIKLPIQSYRTEEMDSKNNRRKNAYRRLLVKSAQQPL